MLSPENSTTITTNAKQLLKSVSNTKHLLVFGYFRSSTDVYFPELIISYCLLYGYYEVTIDNLPNYMSELNCSNELKQIHGTMGIRILVSDSKPYIKEVIDSGVVPKIIELAQQHKYGELQYEALFVLTNIASGPAECTSHIIHKGAHNVLIDVLLKSTSYEIKEQTMWTLGNIAGDGIESKDILLNNKILPNILLICQSKFDKQYVTNYNDQYHKAMDDDGISQFISLLSTTSWTVSNLCRCSPPPTINHLFLLIQCLQSLLKHGFIFLHEFNNKYKRQNDENLCNIGWGFSYLTSFDQYSLQLIDIMDRNGIISQCVNLMDYENVNVRHVMTRIIGNILTGSDENTQKCLNLGILNKYYRMLKTYNIIREKKEICWAISNITAGPIKHKLLVLNNNLYQILIQLLQTAPYEVSKEALWALKNATTERQEKIIKSLIEFGIINALCMFFKKNNKQNQLKNVILLVALQCIENILIVDTNKSNKYDQIVQFIKDLQSQDDGTINTDVYNKCDGIITKYFHHQQPKKYQK